MGQAPSTWILTVSDRAAAGERADQSGPELVARAAELGFSVVGTSVVADGRESVGAALQELVERRIALVLTTGGTGLAPRDLTPEATVQVGERAVPGLMELARQRCIASTPFAALSRGVAVTAGATLIVNLPGNPRAALETLDALADVLPHALNVLTKSPEDCEVTGRGTKP